MLRGQTRLISVRCLLSGTLVALLVASTAWLQAQEKQWDSASLKGLHDAALRFQKVGDLDQAATQYRKFLASALRELAISRVQAGEYSKAAEYFNEAVALNSDPSPLRRDFAIAALQAGDLNRAEALARELLQNDANDPIRLAEAHQILGRTLHKMNRDQDAKKELEAAVALEPSFANEYDLAVVCLDLDDEKCAVRNFDRIKALVGDSPALHMQIGLAYGNSDFTPRAVTEFKKVIAEDPRYPLAHYCVAAALLAAGNDEKTLQEAGAQLREELKISPDNFLTYAALGKIEAGYHRYADAEQYLKRAILLNPKNPDAFLYLGQLYFDTSRFSDAEPNLRKAIELTMDISRNHYQIQKAHFLLGRILMQQHRPKEAHTEMRIARTFTERALKKDRSKLSGMLPDSTASTSRSSEPADSSVTLPVIATHADPEAARKQMVFEKQLIPPIADSYNNLGAITASEKNYAGALQYFERAAAWDPSLGGLDFNLGHAAFLASDFPVAIPPLTRYLRSHPADSGIRVALAMSEFMVRNYTGCLQLLKGAEKSIQSIPQMEYIYAESLVKTGQIAAGRQCLEALETAHPEIAEVHRSLGEIAEDRGESRTALQELNEANRLNANDPETHYHLGKVDLKIGNTEKAILELEQAVRLMPAKASYHQELARAYERAFRMSDADKELSIYARLKGSQTSATFEEAPAQTKGSSQ